MKNSETARQVLLVEPDKLLAASYRRVLTEVNISSEWQQTAQDAINSIDKVRPEIILLEVQLHGHNGIEFLHELRSYPDWQSIPIILLTLVPEHELGLNDQIRQQLSIVEYCYKPQTSLEQLQKLVIKHIGKSE